jgi:arylsulfatase A-like enzyme
MRPNILLIHCHDLGRFLGAYGIPTVRTPHLDRLADDGVRFANAFCAAPQCSPSRAALFTGRYPQQNGVLGLTHSDFAWDLAPGERHLADLLRAAGYATELVGVHHESRIRPDAEVADRLGFDRVRTGGDASAVADRTVSQLAEFAERAERARQAGTTAPPFYLQVGFHEPHRVHSSRNAPGTMGFVADGIDPDDELGVTVPPYLHDTPDARAEIAELQGAVRYLDTGVGRVLDGLRRHGLADSTVVVFTTDHGLALPRAKCTLYDPGLEVALFVRVPGRPAWSARVVDGLVSNIDVVPTILDLVDVPVPATVAGRSLVPLVEHGTPVRSAIFGQLTYHDYYDPRRCVRTARYKLIANFTSAPEVMDCSQSWRPRSMPRSVVGGKVPYHPPLEMYDLTTDPLELTNIVDKAPRVERDALRQALVDWMREVDDPLLEGAVTGPLHHAALEALREPSTP